ncbi:MULTISPECIES: hypothetical protein [Myxococcus]|nr:MULTISPECIES: hypothetical protein [Myxococcus]QPM80888.1 hypothetical protein I5Q59_06200 [Myxococcus xanthus]QVW69948.1 hypothetical protein JTM82_10490 [Myxococcus xanthus DZ2]QZZ48772.1 hypothetical protein MyxoNM_06130 [Myxococcus xanthus]UEO03923.1 hypothetical protein K1515_32320 [Myxococcus xanthus DZ2]UYI15885.1 hypothetical protein N3T43_06105 [Myxococcus xanthus]
MRFVSLLAVACLGLSACASSSFTTEVKGESTVPAGPPGVDTPLNGLPAISSFAGMDFDKNQDFKNQGIHKGEVTSVKVESLTLKVLSPNDQDLRFLDSVEFYARAGDREARIAARQDVSALDLRPPNPVLSLRVDNVELQPFVSAPSMSIIIRGRGIMPAREVRLQAVVKLQVETGLL